MSVLSDLVVSECPSSGLWVPKCPPSSRVFSKCSECNECSSVFQMRLEQNVSYRELFYINKQRSRIRALIWKTFEIGYINFDFLKIEFCFVCTFVRNFRSASVILTLPQNEKASSETSFKQVITRFAKPVIFYLFCEICFEVEKKTWKYSLIRKKNFVEFPNRKLSWGFSYLRVL